MRPRRRRRGGLPSRHRVVVVIVLLDLYLGRHRPECARGSRRGEERVRRSRRRLERAVQERLSRGVSCRARRLNSRRDGQRGEREKMVERGGRRGRRIIRVSGRDHHFSIRTCSRRQQPIRWRRRDSQERVQREKLTKKGSGAEEGRRKRRELRLTSRSSLNSCTRSSEAAATSRARLGLDDDADDDDDGAKSKSKSRSAARRYRRRSNF